MRAETRASRATVFASATNVDVPNALPLAAFRAQPRGLSRPESPDECLGIERSRRESRTGRRDTSSCHLPACQMAGDLNFNFSAPTHRAKVHSSHRWLSPIHDRELAGEILVAPLNLVSERGRESGQSNIKVDQPESTTWALVESRGKLLPKRKGHPGKRAASSFKGE